MEKHTEQYLTCQDIQMRYDIGETTVYRWIKDKKVNLPKPVKLGPKASRWKLSALEHWEQQREQAEAA